MNISECIHIAALLNCSPLIANQEDSYFKDAILIKRKLMEIAYNKAITNNCCLTQPNPIKNKDKDIVSLNYVLTEGPWQNDHWYVKTEYSYCYYDLSSCLEQVGTLCPFYILGTISAETYTAVSSLTADDISGYLDEYDEWFLEFLDEDKLPFLEEDTISLLESIDKAEKNGKTEHELIKVLIKDIKSNHLGKLVDDTSICHNLGSYITLFYSMAGYNTTVTTVGNSLLPKYLKIRCLISDSEEKRVLDKAINAFYSPLSCCMYDALPVVTHSNEWVTVTYVCGGTEEYEYISEENLYPFWNLAANIIDVLLPDILEKNAFLLKDKSRLLPA